MTNKKNLHTGGTCFIGSHVVVEVIQSGLKVINADDLSDNEKSVIDRIEEIPSKGPVFYQIDVVNLP